MGIIAPAKKQTTYTPEGEGRYKYRNISGTPLYLLCFHDGRLTHRHIDKDEEFEGTDAFLSWWMSGRLSLFFDGRESILR